MELSDLPALTPHELERRCAMLERLAVRDDLTGLLNARGFTDACRAEQDRFRRRLSRGALVVRIELEGLAAITCRHGPAASAAGTRHIAAQLYKSVRDMDAAACLRLDQFVLLLTQTDPDAALPRVQRLALELNRQMLPWQEQNLFIGASISVRPLTTESRISELLYPDEVAETPIKTGIKRATGHLAHPLQNIIHGPGSKTPGTRTDV